MRISLRSYPQAYHYIFPITFPALFNLHTVSLFLFSLRSRRIPTISRNSNSFPPSPFVSPSNHRVAEPFLLEIARELDKKEIVLDLRDPRRLYAAYPLSLSPYIAIYKSGDMSSASYIVDFDMIKHTGQNKLA